MNWSFLVSQIYAAATVLLWSTAYVFTKVSLQYFSAGALGLLRCFVASLCLLSIVGWKKLEFPKARDILWFILSGATGFSFYLITFNIGSSLLSPTTSCIIISSSPIITSLMAIAVFKERLGILRWIATGTAFCGILTMTLWEGTFSVSKGIFWMLAAAFLISAYNVMQRWLARRFSPLQITAYSFASGTILLLGSLSEALAQVTAAPFSQILLVCFLGIFPSAAAYIFWGKALAAAPKTSSVTNYMFLTPFLALMLEYCILGVFPGIATFVGGGMILAGLLLFTMAGER